MGSGSGASSSFAIRLCPSCDRGELTEVFSSRREMTDRIKRSFKTPQPNVRGTLPDKLSSEHQF